MMDRTVPIRMALLDRDSSEVLKHVKVEDPTGLAFGPNGQLYGLSDGGKLCRIDLDTGQVVSIPTPGLARPDHEAQLDGMPIDSARRTALAGGPVRVAAIP